MMIKQKNEMKQFRINTGGTLDEIICSFVYEFAKKLPYSMDYMDKDFVPVVFLNLSPEKPQKWLFKDFSSNVNGTISK